MNDNIFLAGEYRFQGYNVAGELVYDQVFKNTVVQNFYENMFFALSGANSNLKIIDFATGTGLSMSQRSDIGLETEVFRKPITQISNTSSQLIIKTSLETFESNFNIKEVGLFTSAGMTSRVNANIEKTASIQYLITYTLTFS